MNDTLKFPFYAKLAFTLLSLIAIFTIIYVGQSIIVPILMAGLFAILLGPINNFLEMKVRLPHTVASVLTVALFVMLFATIISVLSWQIADMINDWEKIKRNLNIHYAHLQEMVRDNFNLTRREQNKIIDSTVSDSSQILGTTLVSVTDILFNVALIPIYTFLILLYRTHFMKFLCKLFREDLHGKLEDILFQIKVSVQSYIIGLAIEMIIVSVLTSIGLMVIGVQYAILLGIITGLLNLIPYIGIFFGLALTILISLSGSTDLSIITGILVVNLVVQIIDNNFLVPMIVSSKVEVNAFVSIIGIIIGGAMIGVAGMFLAIPLIAIMKVIFVRVDELKPWGYLMGDDLPKTFEWGRIKFPFYRPGPEKTINVEIQTPVIFTETTTTEIKTTESDNEPKNQ